MKNKVIVKDRDEWSSFANFIGNMIAKYADEIMDICRILDVSPEQLLTGKDIDEDYIDSPIDYVAKRKDEELLLEIHSLKKEQAKRLMAYLKALS